MKTLFKRNPTDLTSNDFLEGRTLCRLSKAEPDDRAKGSCPIYADYRLIYWRSNDRQPAAFFLSEKEFSSLLTDDVQRIPFEAAREAHVRTLKAYIAKRMGGEGK